eukprot:926609-Lingulodinium_polyedra.AAC.1
MERGIATRAAPQQRNAVLNVFLSSSRAQAVQECVQERIPLLRRRTVRDVRAPYMVVDAWSA